jgi:hypothetical protein
VAATPIRRCDGHAWRDRRKVPRHRHVNVR